MSVKNVTRSIHRFWESFKEDLKQSAVFREMKPAVAVAVILLAAVGLVAMAPFLLQTVSVLAILGVAGLILLGPAVWVYQDARDRGVRHPVGWGVFSVATMSLGALIYFLVRPERPKVVSCAGCQRSIDGVFQACPFCGQEQGPARRSCPSCQSSVAPEWRFCPYCKRNLGVGQQESVGQEGAA